MASTTYAGYPTKVCEIDAQMSLKAAGRLLGLSYTGARRLERKAIAKLNRGLKQFGTELRVNRNALEVWR